VQIATLASTEQANKLQTNVRGRLDTGTEEVEGMPKTMARLKEAADVGRMYLNFAQLE
jgi:hypothetical protein